MRGFIGAIRCILSKFESVVVDTPILLPVYETVWQYDREDYGVMVLCCVTNDSKSSGACMTTMGTRNWHASTSRKQWLRMVTKNFLKIQIHQYGQTKGCSAYVWPQILASWGLGLFLSKLILVFASFAYSFWVKIIGQIFSEYMPHSRLWLPAHGMVFTLFTF